MKNVKQSTYLSVEPLPFDKCSHVEVNTNARPLRWWHGTSERQTPSKQIRKHTNSLSFLEGRHIFAIKERQQVEQMKGEKIKQLIPRVCHFF